MLGARAIFAAHRRPVIRYIAGMSDDLQNVSALRTSLNVQATAIAALEKSGIHLAELKRKTFSPSLLVWDKRSAA